MLNPNLTKTLKVFNLEGYLKRLLQTKKSNPKDEITTSPLVDYAWAKIVGTTSSNSIKLKLVKVLKRCNLACFVTKTLQTPILGFTNCPIDSSISCNVK
jgi:hypothetical protein